MSESPPKLLRKIDVGKLNNDILRPWTVNHQSQEVLRNAINDLERTKAYTTPQKKAGVRGLSVLDQKEPVMIDFENTMKLRATLNGYRTQYHPTTAEQQNGTRSSKSKTSSKLSSRQLKDTINNTNSTEQSSDLIQSNPIATALKILDEDDEDAKFAGRIQKRILNEARRHDKELHRPSEVSAVHYSKTLNRNKYLMLKDEAQQHQLHQTHHTNSTGRPPLGLTSIPQK